MKGDENIIRVETLDDFDRELARDGGETLEVPASLAEEYGLFPRTWAARTRSATPERIRTAPRRKSYETRRIPPPVRRGDHRADPPGHSAVAEALGAGRARAPLQRRYRDAPTRAGTACTLPPCSRSAATATCAGAPTARSRPGTDRCARASRAPASSRSRTTGRSPSTTSAVGPRGTTKASASTATSASRRPSSANTPCSTPSRPTGCRPGPRPLPSRSGRCTSRPSRSSRTAGFPSVTWRATGRSTT